MSLPIDKKFALTIWTNSDRPHHRVFWFGRVDMKDNLKPVKIEARNGKEAWELLEKMEKAKCSTQSSQS